MVNKITYSIKLAGATVSLFCFVLICACSENETIIARVDDVELTEKDAILLMENLGYDVNSEQDWVQFVNFWVERQVFVQELKQKNPEKYKVVELKSKNFQGELARFYLEEDFINKKVDQNIPDSVIEAYYQSHKSDFALNDYIVKALYVKVPKKAPKQEDLNEHYLLKKDKDLSKVISYAKLYADNFYFDDSTWIYFDELTKDMPVAKLNKDNLVLNRTKTHFTDGDYTYFLNIIDYKLRDAVPPLEFMKADIKQIIITQRLNAFKEKKDAIFVQKIKEKHEIFIHL